MRITGTAVVRVDGRELRMLQGATFTPGGKNREFLSGSGKVHGHKEEHVAPAVEGQIAHTKDLSLKWLGDITDATVLFTTDTGKQYILRHAAVTAPPALNSGDGTVDVAFGAEDWDEADV